MPRDTTGRAVANIQKSPHDAELTAAAIDLDRLDAEIAALGAAHPGVDLEEIPGVGELEGNRNAALRDLGRLPASGIRGLAAKAQALQSRNLMDDAERHKDLALSLAHDVERLAALSRADADPIYAAIEASRVAFNHHVAACQSEAAVQPGGDELCRNAGLASHAAWRALLEVRPTTFEGVKALAAYVPEFIENVAWDEDRDPATLFRTIAAVSPGPAASDLVPLEDRLRAEATRLLRIATRDYESRVAAWEAEGLGATELGRRSRDLRRRLRLDALFEAASPAASELPVAAVDPHSLAKEAITEAYDASLLPLIEMAIAEERTAQAVSDTSINGSPPGTFDRAYQLLERVKDTNAQTHTGLAAKARLLLTHIPEGSELEGDWRCEALALSIARDAMRLDMRQPVNVAEDCPPLDPVFEVIAAYRSAHAIHVASLAQPGDADEELMERSDQAFEALLAARPATEAGRLAQLEQVVFGLAYMGHGCAPSEEWLTNVGRLVNGGLPVLADTLTPEAIEPVAADRELHAAIEAHFVAYGQRLHSEVYEWADVATSVEQELAAFQRLLHSRLGTDAGRVAYAKAVLGRAIGAHPEDCQGDGRTAPLAVAYRNLAHGQFWREDEVLRPIAAE